MFRPKLRRNAYPAGTHLPILIAVFLLIAAESLRIAMGGSIPWSVAAGVGAHYVRESILPVEFVPRRALLAALIWLSATKILWVCFPTANSTFSRNVLL